MDHGAPDAKRAQWVWALELTFAPGLSRLSHACACEFLGHLRTSLSVCRGSRDSHMHVRVLRDLLGVVLACCSPTGFLAHSQAMATESSSEVLGLVTQWLRKPCAIDEVMKVEGPAHRAWSQGVGYTRPWNQLLGRILATEKSTWVGPFGRDHRIFLQRAHVEWLSFHQSYYQSTIRRMRRAIENRAPELFDRLGLVDWNQDFLDAESTSTDHWMSEADVMDDDLVESDDDLVESDDDLVESDIPERLNESNTP